MTVTQIEEYTKARSKIYIDQEFAFVLYKGELRLYHIAEGQELSEADYRHLMKEVLPKRAKLRCMNLLKSREYTRQQLKTKLKQGFYPEEVAEEALDYVASYHYIDDDRYAAEFIRCYQESKSRKCIELDLLKKGVDKAVIQRAWQSWENDGNEQNEAEQIRKLLEKRHFDIETADLKTRQKTYAFLMRKGFSAESIRKVLKNQQDDDFYLT